MLREECAELLREIKLSESSGSSNFKTFNEANRATLEYHWRELARTVALNAIERPTKSNKVKELPPFESDLTVLIHPPKPPPPSESYLREEYLWWLANHNSANTTIPATVHIEQLEIGIQSLLHTIKSDDQKSIGRRPIKQEWRREFADLYTDEDTDVTYEVLLDEWLAGLRKKFQRPAPQEVLQQKYGVYDSMFAAIGSLRRKSVYEKEMDRICKWQKLLLHGVTVKQFDLSVLIQDESSEVVQDMIQESRLALLYEQPLEPLPGFQTFEQLVAQRIVQQITSSAVLCQLQEKQEKERKRLRNLFYRDVYERQRETLQYQRYCPREEPKQSQYQNQSITHGQLKRSRLEPTNAQSNYDTFSIPHKKERISVAPKLDEEELLKLPPSPPNILSSIKSVGDLEDEDAIQSFPIESYGRRKDDRKLQDTALEKPLLRQNIKSYLRLPNPQLTRVKPKFNIPIHKPSPKACLIKPSPVFKIVREQPQIERRPYQPTEKQQHGIRPLQDYYRPKQSKQTPPQIQSRFYPYSVWPVVVTADDCYIVYYFSSINEQELCLTFLLDRIKTQANSVRILLTPEQLGRQQDRLFKYVTALTLLGAQVCVEASNRTCESYNRTEFWVARAVASATGRPLESTVRRLREVGWPEDPPATDSRQ